MFAFTELQRKIARILSEKMNKRVIVGQYVDISNSYHIYGSYIDDFCSRFLKALEQRDFYSSDIRKTRTLLSDHPLVRKGFLEADLELEAEKNNLKLFNKLV